MNKNIAVIGCGYWGKNLVRNFAELGSLHTICDTDIKRIEQLISQVTEVNQSKFPAGVNLETDFLKALRYFVRVIFVSNIDKLYSYTSILEPKTVG